MNKMMITLNVNGRQAELAAMPDRTLLSVLRDDLQLTGAKRGCNQGVCGACTVLLDGWPVRACLSLAANAVGHEIVTIEGLAKGNRLAPVQQAILTSGAVQCGFCMSGMLLSAQALLAHNPHPTLDDIRAGLAGNLCRCSGYKKIVEAVHEAAQGAAS